MVSFLAGRGVFFDQRLRNRPVTGLQKQRLLYLLAGGLDELAAGGSVPARTMDRRAHSFWSQLGVGPGVPIPIAVGNLIGPVGIASIGLGLYRLYFSIADRNLPDRILVAKAAAWRSW